MAEIGAGVGGGDGAGRGCGGRDGIEVGARFATAHVALDLAKASSIGLKSGE